MTPEQLEDDAARPLVPRLPGLTAEQRASGRHLAAIHRMHLGNLAAVGRIMGQIRSGLADPASLGPAIADMSLTRNMSEFGTICGHECAMLQSHHDIEEYSIFPALAAQADPQLQAVLDRLIAEHQVIHDLLGRLAGAAQALTRDPNEDQFATVEAAYAVLDRAIRSHFGYEETQLEDALGASGLLG